VFAGEPLLAQEEGNILIAGAGAGVDAGDNGGFRVRCCGGFGLGMRLVVGLG